MDFPGAGRQKPPGPALLQALLDLELGGKRGEFGRVQGRGQQDAVATLAAAEFGDGQPGLAGER